MWSFLYALYKIMWGWPFAIAMHYVRSAVYCGAADTYRDNAGVHRVKRRPLQLPPELEWADTLLARLLLPTGLIVMVGTALASVPLAALLYGTVAGSITIMAVATAWGAVVTGSEIPDDV